MTVQAFRMQLKPGTIDEYRRRHDLIWPELVDLLRTAGISEYRIFVDPITHSLFATLSLAKDNRRESLPGESIMRRWWDHMADLMEVEPGNKPREWALDEVFYLP